MAATLGTAAACQLPADEPSGLTRDADFRSSQSKPHDRTRAALPANAPSSERNALRADYLAGPLSAQRKARLLGDAPRLDAGTRDVHAGAIAHLRVSLAAGQRVDVDTRALADGTDPVLHLWWIERGREVAFDDDSGSDSALAAHLSYRAPEAGTFVVVARAYRDGDAGRCDVYVDGVRRLRDAVVGGSATRVPLGRRLHAVLIADRAGAGVDSADRAALDPLLLLVDASSGHLLAVDDDSGVELGAQLDVRRDGGAASADQLVIVGAYDGASEGRVRLVVNDVGTDSDGDGLGDALEQAACLCSSSTETVCGFDCRTVNSPQDSDGDGLSDADELLGKADDVFPQLLPRWGADPRHKDLFVEIDLADFVDTLDGFAQHHVGRTLSTLDAHSSAAVFAKLTAMNNPDGKDGVALHLDVGHRCGDAPLGVDGTCGALCSVGPDGATVCGQSWWHGPPTPRADSLHPSRRHLFKVAVADCLIAGRASLSPSDNLEFDCDRWSAMVHELGHTFGLYHYGPVGWGTGNCKPNYPSLMNYAYSDGFAETRDLQFSDGSLVGAFDLDPRDIDETRPFGGPDADASWLATRPFSYKLDCASGTRGCRVDWNRDGRFDPSVRAYLSPMPGYGAICENEHGNTQDGKDSIGELDASGGVAAAVLDIVDAQQRSQTTLHVFAPALDGGGARLHLATQKVPDSDAPDVEPEPWSAWRELDGPLLRADTQPAAVRAPGVDEIWVFATVDGESPIRTARLDRHGTLSAWSALPGQPAGLRARDVSVAAHGGDVVLVVHDESGAGGDRVLASRYTPAGWSAQLVALSAEGRALRSRFTPGIAAAADGRLYLVTSDPDPPLGSGAVGRLHLYSAAAGALDFRDEELYGVRFVGGTPTLEYVPWSRPAMAFAARRDGNGAPLSDGRGYLAIWYTRVNATRWLTTWGQLDQRGANFALGRWHHYEAYGYIRALRAASPAIIVHSTHLGAALTEGAGDAYRIRWVPFADGVPRNKLLSRDYDDRQNIRANLCTGLNASCPERCKRLTDPCGDPDAGGSGSAGARRDDDVQCALPDWRQSDGVSR